MYGTLSASRNMLSAKAILPTGTGGGALRHDCRNREQTAIFLLGVADAPFNERSKPLRAAELLLVSHVFPVWSL